MLRISLLLCLAFTFQWCFSQKSYQYKLTVTPETCAKGSALLEISGLESLDTIQIDWSTGAKNVYQIFDLIGGNYFVQTKIKHHKDSLVEIKDTTLYFRVEKIDCDVIIDTYFSPNEDGYHDVLGIVNWNHYPNFEFVIYNKWGQQIHHQKQNYKPWDGKWNGAEVPDGSYYYIFFFDASDKNKALKGDVTILR